MQGFFLCLFVLGPDLNGISNDLVWKHWMSHWNVHISSLEQFFYSQALNLGHCLDSHVPDDSIDHRLRYQAPLSEL